VLGKKKIVTDWNGYRLTLYAMALKSSLSLTPWRIL